VKAGTGPPGQRSARTKVRQDKNWNMQRHRQK